MTHDSSDKGVLHPADLSLIERTYLGVLDTGMVSARLAGDPTLRLDHVAAVCLALREQRPRDAYLAEDSAKPAPAFRAALTRAVYDLEERGVLTTGAPPSDILLSPGLPPTRTRSNAPLDFDQRPLILLRYLAHECMEELFQDTRVYPFLMGKYQDSGEVYGRLYKENPQRFL